MYLMLASAARVHLTHASAARVHLTHASAARLHVSALKGHGNRAEAPHFYHF